MEKIVRHKTLPISIEISGGEINLNLDGFQTDDVRWQEAHDLLHMDDDTARAYCRDRFGVEFAPKVDNGTYVVAEGMTPVVFLEFLQFGPLTDPGEYPVYFKSADGSTLSFETAVDNCDLITASIRANTQDEWQVTEAGINWSDDLLQCSITGEFIPVAEEAVH